MFSKSSMTVRSLKLSAMIEHWPLKALFFIAGRVWEKLSVVVVTLEKDGLRGYGEAAGVYYRDDTVTAMIHQIEHFRAPIERQLSRESLQRLMPASGARNAVDCALWDLEAKLSGQSAWQLAGLVAPGALLTTFTCGADTLTTWQLQRLLIRWPKRSNSN